MTAVKKYNPHIAVLLIESSLSSNIYKGKLDIGYIIYQISLKMSQSRHK